MQPALLADELDGDANNNSGQADGQQDVAQHGVKQDPGWDFYEKARIQ